MTKDVMIDLESFGNGKHAAICQIGACYFNRFTGEIGDTLKINVDAVSAQNTGAELDADTVYWWLSQSKEAIESVTRMPRINLMTAVYELNNFLEPADAIWSHASFDFVILTETLRRLQITPKFNYKACRDIRTLVDLARVNPKGLELTRDGVHHDALDDCKFQVKYCTRAFSKIFLDELSI